VTDKHITIPRERLVQLEGQINKMKATLLACRPYVHEAYQEAGRRGTPFDRQTEDEIGAIVDTIDELVATKGSK